MRSIISGTAYSLPKLTIFYQMTFAKTRQSLMYEMLQVCGISVKTETELLSVLIDREVLINNTDIITNIRKLVSKMKPYYSSDTLTCLHQNSCEKQKYPVINFLRQILKCNDFALKPGRITCGCVNGKRIRHHCFYVVRRPQVLTQNCSVSGATN